MRLYGTVLDRFLVRDAAGGDDATGADIINVLKRSSGQPISAPANTITISLGVVALLLMLLGCPFPGVKPRFPGAINSR